MHIEMTVPLTTDGLTFGEIKCQIDVRVTYVEHGSYFKRGMGDPGVDAEFVVDAYYVDCGGYKWPDGHGKGKMVRYENWYAAPVDIIPYIDAYIDGEGRQSVIDGIREYDQDRRDAWADTRMRELREERIKGEG